MSTTPSSFRSFFDAPTPSLTKTSSLSQHRSTSAFASSASSQNDHRHHHQANRPVIRFKSNGPLTTASMNASLSLLSTTTTTTTTASSLPVTPSSNAALKNKKRPAPPPPSAAAAAAASQLSSSPTGPGYNDSTVVAQPPPKKRLVIKKKKSAATFAANNGLLTPPASSSPGAGGSASSRSASGGKTMSAQQRQRQRQRPPRVSLSSSPAPSMTTTSRRDLLPAHPSSEDAPTSILLAPSSPGYALPSSPIPATKTKTKHGSTAASSSAAVDLLLGLNDPTRGMTRVTASGVELMDEEEDADRELEEADERYIKVIIPIDGTPVIVGRSRSAPLSASHADGSELGREVKPKPHPTRAGHLLAPLPRSAKHVSRAHVVVRAAAAAAAAQESQAEEEEESLVLKMRVEGQNGCRVRRWRRRGGAQTNGSEENAMTSTTGDTVVATPPRRWQRFAQGDEISLSPGDQIDLWSCRIEIVLGAGGGDGATEQKQTQQIITRNTSPSDAPAIVARDGSFAPSSPLSESSSMGDEMMDGDMRRDGLELDAQDDVQADEEMPPSVEVKREAVAAATAEAAPVHAPASVAVIPPPPSDIDLLALVATTVVFSGSSATTQPDLVKGMLESQPSLRSRADEQTWSAWIGSALRSHEMFGIIDRKGKDSSGKPLLPLFFYQPSHDPDAERAKELASVMRPIRSAIQRGGNRAIDWRPVGSRSKRY